MEDHDKSEALEDLKLIKNTLVQAEFSPKNVSVIFIRYGFLLFANFLVYFLSLIGPVFGNTVASALNVIACCASVLCACLAVFIFFFYRKKHFSRKNQADRKLINIWGASVVLPCVLLLLTIRMPFLNSNPFAFYSCKLASIIFALLLLVMAITVTGILTGLNFYILLSILTVFVGIAYFSISLKSGPNFLTIVNMSLMLKYFWDVIFAAYLLITGLYLKLASKKHWGE